MKKVYGFVLVAICFSFLQGCSDEPEARVTSITPKIGTVGGTVLITGTGLNKQSEVSFNGVDAEILYSDLYSIFVKVPNATTGKISVKSGEQKIESNFSFEISEPTGGSWQQKNDFPGAYRVGSVCFSSDEFGFVGLGLNDNVHLKDLWSYTPASDTWTRLTDFPGQKSIVGSSFVIDNMAYVFVDSILQSKPELWVYDIETDAWTEKEIIFSPLYDGIVVESTIIAAIPYQSNVLLCVKSFVDYTLYYYDFIEYDPVSGQCESVSSNFASGLFSGSTSTTAYFISMDQFSSSSLLMKFDLSTGTWSEESIPNIYTPLSGFSTILNDTLYYGLGSYYFYGMPVNGAYPFLSNNTWGYSLISHAWFTVTPSPFLRSSSQGFNINDKRYVIFGLDETNRYTNELIEFTP